MRYIPQAAVDLVKQFEGLFLKAYPDPKTGGEPWTIGYGHTRNVHRGDTCRQEQADAWLRDDLAEAAAAVARSVSVPLNGNQFAALASLVFNVGPGSADRDGIVRLKNGQPSTLRRRLNSGDYTGAADAFLAWVSPGSAVEHGLRVRRTAERHLFLTPGE